LKSGPSSIRLVMHLGGCVMGNAGTVAQYAQCLYSP